MAPATLSRPWASALAGGTNLASSALGSGCNTPTPPAGLSYPSSSLSLTTGTLMTPLVPTLAEGGGGSVDVVYSVDPPLPNTRLGAITLSPGVRSGVLSPDNPSPISYRVPEHTLPAGLDLLNLWLPAGTPPTNGWPVFTITGLAGWAGLAAISSLDPGSSNKNYAWFHDMVNAGIAFIWAGINGGGTQTAIPGWFYPPGHSSGVWENRNSFLPEHALLDLIQWVKDQATYPLDGDRICCSGVSAGSASSQWVAAYPELRLTSGSTQIQQSSAINCHLALLNISDFLAILDDWDIATLHFESRFASGSDCGILENAYQDVREIAGPVRLIDVPGNKCGHLPMFIACDEPTSAATTQFGLGLDRKPLLRDTIGSYVHDQWHSAILAHVLRRIHPSFHGSKSELWLADAYASQVGTLIGEVTGTFTGAPGSIATGDADVYSTLYGNALSWLVDRLTEDRPNPAGLHIDPFTGAIFGTPNQTQSATVHTVSATSELGVATAQVTIEVT